MSSSENEGFVRTDSAAFDADTAIDAGLYHDLCDSLAHLCDELGQVRVCFPYRGSVYLDTQAPASTSVWYPIAVLAVWPMTVTSDLNPYKLRVRATCASSGGASCTFRLVLAPAGRSAEYAQVASPGDNVVSGSTTSTTPVDLTLSSDLCDLTSDLLQTSRLDLSTFDDVSGAVPVSVDVSMVEFSVWAQTANTGSTPQLWGCYAAEYVGL